jgi:cytochrome c-L
MRDPLIRHFGKPGTAALSATALTLCCVVGIAQQIQFRHAFDDAPLDVTPKPGEPVTEAVQEFHRTGQNPYNGKPDAIEDGKKLYVQFCQACHGRDGSGGMGVSLTDPKVIYERIRTDVGLFEVIFGGASGAMQPFSKRMTQDQILRVMAFVRTIMKA